MPFLDGRSPVDLEAKEAGYENAEDGYMGPAWLGIGRVAWSTAGFRAPQPRKGGGAEVADRSGNLRERARP